MITQSLEFLYLNYAGSLIKGQGKVGSGFDTSTFFVIKRRRDGCKGIKGGSLLMAKTNPFKYMYQGVQYRH